MDAALTVCCTLIGWKWADVWVHRLQRMVEQNCSVPHRFVCITDRALAGVETLPLSREIVRTREHHSCLRDDERMVLNLDKPQGCWGKLDAFVRDWHTPVLHLDLDVVILNDVASLIREDLAMPVDSPGHFNGSVYSFTPSEKTRAVYPKKIPYSKYPRGEQEYVADTYGDVQPLAGCYSYKHHVACRGGKPPEDAVIVYFHGFPTPASKSVEHLGWVNRTWKGLEKTERE